MPTSALAACVDWALGAVLQVTEVTGTSIDALAGMLPRLGVLCYALGCLAPSAAGPLLPLDADSDTSLPCLRYVLPVLQRAGRDVASVVVPSALLHVVPLRGAVPEVAQPEVTVVPATTPRGTGDSPCTGSEASTVTHSAAGHTVDPSESAPSHAQTALAAAAAPALGSTSEGLEQDASTATTVTMACPVDGLPTSTSTASSTASCESCDSTPTVADRAATLVLGCLRNLGLGSRALTEPLPLDACVELVLDIVAAHASEPVVVEQGLGGLLVLAQLGPAPPSGPAWAKVADAVHDWHAHGAYGAASKAHLVSLLGL